MSVIKGMVVGLFVMCAALGSAARAAQDDTESRYAPTPPVEYPGGVKSLRDVTYAEISGFRPLTLDLYLPPESASPKPLVVFVHGGAWRHRTARDGGTFHDFPSVLAAVAARGYVVASVNYRLLGEARFPAAVQDVAMSLRWLRANAGKYGIDPARVIAWGSSAGGQIATLIGTACDAPLLLPPSSDGASAHEVKPGSACVQGVIDWYGIVDLASNGADLGRSGPAARARESAYLGCEVAKCPAELLRSATALTYIDERDPPFLIQHGTADTSVSAKQSQRLHDALRKAGVSSELILYPNVDHGFAAVPGGGPDDAVNRQALADVYKFLARHFPSSAAASDTTPPGR
jgi:acetyl esterase/lipase